MSLANHDYFPKILQPCYLLQESGIPCVVWFEDAVRYHGGRVVPHALHLLVPNIEEAADVLVKNDWTLITPEQKKIVDPFAHTVQRCLRPPKLAPMLETTILLPAMDWNWNWNCSLPEECDASTFFPPLPQLLDALIDSELDLPPGILRLHISCMIGYLHDYIPYVKTRKFVQELRYDNRQYHLDWLAGMSTATNSFIKHQRAIRDALRQGIYQLQECSASSDNEKLFMGETMARLAAKQPHPYEDVSEIKEDEEEYVYDLSKYNPKDIQF